MKPVPIKPQVTLDVFNQLDIRVGTIVSVTDIPNSDQLCQLRVSFGDHERSIVAGIRISTSKAGVEAPGDSRRS